MTSLDSRQKARPHSTRPRTARTARTALSTLGGLPVQHIICAVIESRGVAPTVGLAFVNVETSKALLCEICDSQTYVRTMHMLSVYAPTEILVVSTAAQPKTKLFSILEDNLDDIGSTMILLDRKYWAETTGVEYIQQLAFREDVETVKISLHEKYFAICCLAAALKYLEQGLHRTFAFHSLSIEYTPFDGAMMIDVATIRSLELIQNSREARSTDCLFGLLNQTQTPMGPRLLRSNILQPLTNEDVLSRRYDAVDELASKEEMFFSIRGATKNFPDADKLLAYLVLLPVSNTLQMSEQNINNVIALRQFVVSVKPIFEALGGCCSELLRDIQNHCAPTNIDPVIDLIDQVINEDVTYAKQPLELRWQRTFAVKAGVNGLLDVSRLTFKENSEDACAYVTSLSEQQNLDIDLKFDNVRQYFLRINRSRLETDTLPSVFINLIRKKDTIECSTMDLLKRNQKIVDSHNECVLLSHDIVEKLLEELRTYASILHKISESIALLDMISAFAQLVTINEYTRPQFNEALAIKSGRHPIKEKLQHSKFVPNDVYATQQTRFQIITGANMSGKSTYIRSVALLVVMAQIGCFVPAEYAALPIRQQLFARISTGDSIESNVSTFAAEMRETAFILRNIQPSSLAIIDELGRGTSSRDGLAIAIAIAEALVDSRALIWFATHFTELPSVLAERNGVINLHLSVHMPDHLTMQMLYKVAAGVVREKHYGLSLARIITLPEGVMQHAEHVAGVLEQKASEKRETSLAVLVQRRRRLMLDLREHLLQAQKGRMEGDDLKEWLKQLQREFIIKMSELDQATKKGEARQKANNDIDNIVDGSSVVKDPDEESDRSDVMVTDGDIASSDILRTPR